MDCESESSSVRVAGKSVKLAVVENARPLLAPRLSEPEDSGIDSDDPSLLRAALSLQLSEESSCSDEDASEKSLCWALTHMNTDEKLKEMGDTHETLDILIEWTSQTVDMESSLMDSEPDRSSPPLFEVELTASDEDDDASVLELVIPIQSRYQRVPTSSPKKGQKKKSCLCLAKLFCCLKK